MCSIGVVDRLTDPSKYTGAHKERFDETGKGKGIEGKSITQRFRIDRHGLQKTETPFKENLRHH